MVTGQFKNKIEDFLTLILCNIINFLNLGAFRYITTSPERRISVSYRSGVSFWRPNAIVSRKFTARDARVLHTLSTCINQVIHQKTVVNRIALAGV